MAPSATSALNPIVIDPILVPPHFTTAGAGLLYASHPRETAASLKPLLSGITNKSKPKPWWRAQCLLYGLDVPEKATIQELRAALEKGLARRGGLVVPEELVELEHRENGKFRKLNATVREATAKEAGMKGKETTKGKTMTGKTAAGKDVLKAVKAGQKQKIGKKPVGKKTVKVAAPKKAKKVDAQQVSAVEPYEGEPMMWPMEMDIDEEY